MTGSFTLPAKMLWLQGAAWFMPLPDLKSTLATAVFTRTEAITMLQNLSRGGAGKA
jgi:hypothetical protein